MGTYNIKYSWRFKLELDNIIYYIDNILMNPIASNNLINLYLKKCSNLQMFPYSFSPLKPQYCSKRYFKIKNYLFIYSINEKSKTV